MRLVVFDTDGALTDTTVVDDECFLRAAEVLGLDAARFKLAAAGVEADRVPFICADDALTREELLRCVLARAGVPRTGG